MGTITAELVEITPDLAEEWLEHNVDHNRRITMSTVDKLAIEMEQGNWRLTHQGIAFDAEGKLVDGQHRLFAIYKSRCTVTMFVTRGLDPATFTVMDSGRNRTAGDMVDIAIKAPNARTLAASLKLIRLYRIGNRPWPTGLITNAQVAQTALEIGIEVHQWTPVAQRAYKRLGGTKSAFGAAFYLIMEWAAENKLAEYAEDWIEGLVSGVGLEGGDPRLALESWLKGTGSKYPSAQKSELTLMLTLRVFEASLTKKRIVKLQVSDPSYYNFRLPERDGK